MHLAQIGRSGLFSAKLGFGCMGLSGSYGSVDRTAAINTVQAAIASDITLFDTADVYGAGENERLLGNAVSAQRKQVLIATKGGATRDNKGHATNCGTPEYLISACEASLSRLGTDYIDLYYLHRIDPQVPVEESIGAMARLVEQGKVRAIGLSEVSEATLRRACQIHPISALQSEFSLSCRQPAQSMFKVCKELDVSFVSYSPLGRGLLTGLLPGSVTGSSGDLRKGIPRFSPDNIEHNLQLVARVSALAESLGLTTAQLALAWVLNQPSAPLAIPGTRSAARVTQNVRAADVILGDDVLEELDDLFAEGAIRGERHNAQMLARVGL